MCVFVYGKNIKNKQLDKDVIVFNGCRQLYFISGHPTGWLILMQGLVSPMFYMTKSQFDKEFAKAQRKNESIEYRRKLREERTKYWPKFKIPSTSKLVLWAGFVLSVEIVFFCQYLAVKTFDTAPLIAMIGAIGGLITMFHTYSKKSTVENSRGGIVFETALLSQAKQNSDCSDEAVG